MIFCCDSRSFGGHNVSLDKLQFWVDLEMNRLKPRHNRSHSGLRNASCRFYIWSVFILSSKVWPWEYSIGENLTMDIYLFFVKLVKNLLSFDLKFTKYIFLETPKVKSHEIEVPTRCMAALGTRISRIEIHGWMFLMARILTLNDIPRLYCLQWMAVRDSEDLSFC